MKNLNRYIDHTNLKPNASKSDIIKLCSEAKEYEFASVCVNPYYVKLVSDELRDNKNVVVCSVIGFPLGANTLESKMFEAHNACMNGANEIDMVINIAELKNKNVDYCISEINKIKSAIGNNVLKVIVETAYLTQEEKVLAAEIVLKSNAEFIKTSTGFASSGAQLEDIKLWKSILKDVKKIKAAGGIRTKEDAIKFIKAGADRLGASSGVQIMNDESCNNTY
ncbi:MAG: deoxyribose-phosphate aldolase [Ureaplasma sp.]|nr:deoxyribose-phosphate aldolase [Ureaplasma sp.]